MLKRPDRHVQPPRPPLRPPRGPERAADQNANGAEKAGTQRQEQPQPMDTERADGVADDVLEESVLVLRRLNFLSGGRIDRGKNQRGME